MKYIVFAKVVLIKVFNSFKINIYFKVLNENANGNFFVSS